ncbi:uncharacterized protein LOC143358624 [Halictus rubicundus]|uniref:uncharacterized protein LOC143358624 n=1 Tax=Halictus rubicundus TaxID=77578 RepID=UPI004034FF2E
MERNIQSRRTKRVLVKLPHYVRISSDEETRKRIRLVPASTLEDNIAKFTPALTMDTVDNNTMDKDTFKQTYRPTPLPRTYAHNRGPQTNTVTYTQTPGTSTSTSTSISTDVNSDVHMLLDRQTSLMQGEFEKIHSRMDKLEDMLTKLLKQQAQDNQVKPSWLPITTVAAMREFQNARESYNEVVSYLQYVGGYNLKEAVNLCFKEAFDDNLLVGYSWRGMEPDKLCLQDTEIIRAIHDAVIVNKHYDRPSKQEIEARMVAALRTAKERVRSRTRRQAAVYVKASNSDNFWDEDEGELEN